MSSGHLTLRTTAEGTGEVPNDIEKRARQEAGGRVGGSNRDPDPDPWTGHHGETEVTGVSVENGQDLHLDPDIGHAPMTGPDSEEIGMLNGKS